jgi:hypothetical protein
MSGYSTSTIKEQIAALNRQNDEQARQAAENSQRLQAYQQALLNNADNEAERQQTLIDAAISQRQDREAEIKEARKAAAYLRNNNECTDNQEDVKQQIENQRRLTEAQRQLNIAEREQQQRIAELIQQEDEQEEKLALESNRRDYVSSAQVAVDFLNRNDETQNQLLPVNLPQSDNIDELSNNADIAINNVFTNHYNKNLTTYMQNKIKINEMKNKIDNLNSNLHRKMNKNITYGTDGEMIFY